MRVLITAKSDLLAPRLHDDFVFQVANWPSMLDVPLHNAILLTVQAAKSVHPENFDYVVLVNDLGWGLLVAEQLPEELRSQTLVVLERGEPAGREATYRALGYSSFCNYGDVPNRLKEMYYADRDH